jgi:uncharacterized protein YaaQ
MSSKNMKMVVAIVRDLDEDEILQALIGEEFRVTRIASSGGFFRRGNATFMIGVEEEKVERVIQVIRDRCAPTLDLAVKHATVFVLGVDHYEQI